MEAGGGAALVQRSPQGRLSIYPSLGYLFLRPEATEGVLMRAGVALRDQELRVLPAPEVEDGERMSFNLCDTSPRPATVAFTAL